MENVWGIHCTVCTTSEPCSRCRTQIADEQAWLVEHMKTCQQPLPLCSPCGGAFNLRSYPG